MTFMYIFAHSAILRRKRRGIYPKEIKLANNKPILTTAEAANKGQELRNQHADMLMNKQPSKFQDLVASQKTSNIRTYGR